MSIHGPTIWTFRDSIALNEGGISTSLPNTVCIPIAISAVISGYHYQVYR